MAFGWLQEVRRNGSMAEAAEAGDAGDAREDAPNPMALMGDILDKLKILGYEEFAHKNLDGRLLHVAYFVVPHPKPNEQFHYFTQIFAYLMKLNKFSFEAPDEFDDPNSTVANVMEVRACPRCCHYTYTTSLRYNSLLYGHACTPRGGHSDTCMYVSRRCVEHGLPSTTRRYCSWPQRDLRPCFHNLLSYFLCVPVIVCSSPLQPSLSLP